MPVYESIKNADNKIVISAANRDAVVFGWDKVIAALADKVAAGAKNVAIDGWYGIDYAKIATALADAIKARGLQVELIPAVGLYLSREEIIAYNHPFVTDDPGFGKVNRKGVIEDIMSPQAIEAAKSQARLSRDDLIDMLSRLAQLLREKGDTEEAERYARLTREVYAFFEGREDFLGYAGVRAQEWLAEEVWPRLGE